jgi:hypothetical protein
MKVFPFATAGYGRRERETRADGRRRRPVARVDATRGVSESVGMVDELTERADRVLAEALEATGARDPREFYRERLRELRQANPEGYEHAVAYYRETLIPAVANGTSPALAAWTEYGRVLAEAVTPGRTVSIDETGLARPYEGPGPDRLVLHLPSAKGGRALLVGLPQVLSTAQRATFDVLVAGRQKIQE